MTGIPFFADGPLPRVERDETGDYPNPIFFHTCADGRAHRTFLSLGPEGWQWAADGSLEPSVNCQRCHTHGWWTATGWRSA